MTHFKKHLSNWIPLFAYAVRISSTILRTDRFLCVKYPEMGVTRPLEVQYQNEPLTIPRRSTGFLQSGITCVELVLEFGTTSFECGQNHVVGALHMPLLPRTMHKQKSALGQTILNIRTRKSLPSANLTTQLETQTTNWLCLSLEQIIWKTHLATAAHCCGTISPVRFEMPNGSHLSKREYESTS